MIAFLRYKSLLCIVLAFCSLAAAPSFAEDVATSCASLKGGALSRYLNQQSSITTRFAMIPDAPTSIISARIIAPERGLPEICSVEGQIAPSIGFLLELPTQDWNGKLMMGGCGGPCGKYLNDRLEPALARHYAVVTTDMGHKGVGWLFAYQNLQGQIDFGSRATHLTAVAAKDIVDVFYGKQAAKAYFSGCSTGGRQAMVEAQRFPEDFNGIIAGAPPYNEVGDTPFFLSWGARANIGGDGKPILDARKLPAIHKAVLAACGNATENKLGFLLNPEACDWRPTQELCKAGVASDDCLTQDEADVVQKIYDGARNSAGRKLYFGMARGSELNWTPGFINSDGKPGLYLIGFGGPGNSLMTYGAYFYSVGPGYHETDFNYDVDPQRLSVIEGLYDAQNPDLRAFREAGGKLILYHGWNDNQIPPQASIDYYRTATGAAGGPDATKGFFRLFMMPAMNHCRSGDGGGEADWLTALENWVEKGQAPDQIIAYRAIPDPYPTIQVGQDDGFTIFPRHPLSRGSYDRSRPVYPYPNIANYVGNGDPGDAASWQPAH